MASQNRDIKMRIFLDAANAEKAYNALMRNIESSQKRIQELKNIKKSTGNLTAEQTEELKQLQNSVKVFKVLVKEARGSYESIVESVRHSNSLAIRELEGLIKSTKDQLRSLQPGKDDKQITELSSYLGTFQRELAKRNQQILHESQRSFKAILTDINTSQQHLAEMSTKGSNAAFMRQQQSEAQKNLTRMEQKRRNEEEKFAKHQQEIATRQAEFDRAIVGQKQEIITAIKNQVNAEANLQMFLSKKPRSAAARASYDADKQAREQAVATTKQRMQAILAANAVEADSINALILLYQKLVAEQIRPVRKPNADKWDASIAEQKQKVSEATREATKAEAEYAAARSKAGTDTPYQHSIETLKKLYVELEAVRNKETEVAERMKMTDQLKEMDRIIQEMEGKRMSMEQARKVAKSPYATQIEDLKKARQAWEEYRLSLNATDVKGLREVDAAIKAIDNATLRAKENASNWKQTLADARKAYNASNQNTNATSLEALRAQYERLKQARDLVMEEPARNSMNEQLRQMEQRMQEMQTQMMSGRKVSEVYSQAIAEIGKGSSANSAKLRENIELMKVAQKSKEIDAQTYNRLSAAIKVSTDMLNKEGNSYLTTSQALQAYRRGSQLLAQGENSNVDAIRQVITAMNDAQHIEGINVKQKQIYASMSKRLSDLVNQERQSLISLTDANAIYTNGVNNTVGNIQSAIAAYKAMAEAEKTSAADAAEYSNRVRELENTLQGNVRVIFDNASASAEYIKAQDMLRNSSKYTGDELRRQYQIMQQATTARGLSLDITKKCAAAEREFEEILKQSNTSTMTAAEADTKIAEAKVMLQNIYNEETAAIRNMVEQLKLAESAEGMLLTRSQEAIGIRKQMEQALNRSTGATMSYAQAQDVLAKGDAALVSEINDAIASLEAENNMWNTTAETKKRNITLMEQLRAMTSVTRKEATALAYDQNAVNTALQNLKTISVDKLRDAIQMLKNKLNEAKMSQQKFVEESSKLNKLEARYKSLKGSVDGVTKSVQNQGTWFDKAATKLLNYIGIFGGFFMVRQKMTEWFKANMQFDDQLTNIRKTTNMTSEAVKQLADDIKHIQTRTSVSALNDLAYTAGKLGVKSVSDVMGFVRAADMLNVSLSEQLGDNATEQLMKIANIMGTMEQYGLEESLERIGGSITYLAKNSQASAQPIVDFMKRTAGIARQSGITTSELAGLGAAISALNQPVEMSATSFSKMMVQMEKNHVAVAKALQMTSEETRRLKLDLSTGNAMEAFLTMLRKVRELGGLSQTSIIAKDLGSEGNRVIQTLTTLSSSYETIERMVRQSSKAFQENITVQDEYNKKNENTAALWAKLKNNFAKLFVSSEATEYIHDFLQQLQFLPKVVSDVISAMRPLGEFLADVVLIAFRDFSFVLTGLVKSMIIRSLVSWVATLGLQFVKLGSAIKGIPTVLSGFISSISLATGGVAKLGAGVRGFFTMLKSAQFGNIFTAVLGGILMAVDYVRNLNSETKEFLRQTAKEIENVKETANATSVELEGMIDELGKASTTAGRKQEIYEQLNNTYKDYLSNLNWESLKYQDQVRLLRQVNSQLQMKQMLAARDARIQEIRSEGVDTTAPLRAKLRNEVLEAMGITPGDATQTQKSTAESIVNELIKKQEEILDKDTQKKAGNRYSADNSIVSALTDSEQAKLNALYGAFGNTKVIKGIANYNDIASALEKYANATDKINQQIEDTASDFNAQAMQAGEGIDATMAGFKKTMDDVYGSFADNFSQHGKFNVASELTQSIKDVWAEQKETMSKDDRNAEIAKLDVYIEAARNYVDDVLLKYGAESEEYQKANNTYLNAMSYRDILSLGNIVVAPTNDKEADKKRKEAQKEMDNLIAKVKRFYELQAFEYEKMKNANLLTDIQYQRAIEDNEMEMNRTLATARKTIVGDVDEATVWANRVQEMASQNIAGVEGFTAWQRIFNVSGPGKNGVRNIGKQFEQQDKADGTALTNDIRLQSAKDENAIQKVLIERVKRVQNAWLDLNPLGKLSDETYSKFEELGIMLTDWIKGEATIITRVVDESTGKLIENITRQKMTAEEVEQEVMSGLREIGENTFKYDVYDNDAESERSLEAFRNYIGQFPLFAKRASELTDKEIKMIYYKSYEYAEQYQERVTTLINKQQQNWKKMLSSSHDTIEELVKQMDLEQLQKAERYLVGYGLSSRVALQEAVIKQQAAYAKAKSDWEKMQKMALDQYKAAVASGDSDEIKLALSQVEALQKPTDAVLSAIRSLDDAMLQLRENTYGWLGDVEKSFEKFGTDIFKLRSWYEEKGDFWKNTFGTKAERQEAFAAFVDDLKRTLRSAIVEQTRASISKWLIKKINESRAAKAGMSVEQLSQSQPMPEPDNAVHDAILSDRVALERKYEDASLAQAREYGENFQGIFQSIYQNTFGKYDFLSQFKNDFDNAFKAWKTGKSPEELKAEEEKKNAPYYTPNSEYEEVYKQTPYINADSVNQKRVIVIHHTGEYGSDPAKSAVNTFLYGGRSSAHAVIDKDGRRTVMATPDMQTWHAGKNYEGMGTWWGNYDERSRDPRYNGGVDRRNVNAYAIGVEMAGDTTKHPLTEDQIRSLAEYLRPIIIENNIPLENIVSHGDVVHTNARGLKYKDDVTQEALAVVKQYLLENVYTADSGLPLTQAEADKVWADPDWRSKRALQRKQEREFLGDWAASKPTLQDVIEDLNTAADSAIAAKKKELELQKQAEEQRALAAKAQAEADAAAIALKKAQEEVEAEKKKQAEEEAASVAAAAASQRATTADENSADAVEQIAEELTNTASVGPRNQDLIFANSENPEPREYSSYSFVPMEFISEEDRALWYRIAAAAEQIVETAGNTEEPRDSENRGQDLIFKNKENPEPTYAQPWGQKVLEGSGAQSILSMAATDAINGDFSIDKIGQAALEKAKQTAVNKLVSIEEKGVKKLLTTKRQAKKEEQQLEQLNSDAVIDINEEKSDTQVSIEGAASKAISQIGESALTDAMARDEAGAVSSVNKAAVDTTAGIASGSAKTIGELGWWGIPLIGVISAALTALLNAAFNMIGGGHKAKAAPKTKLVSGMLTYDNGNVQSVVGGVGVARTYDRGRRPVMGDDGKLYYVEDRDYGVSPQTGLITRPTLTSIGGQPALVAENGPEMVIGRETTKALAMNEPEVLRTIMRYDANHSRGFAKTFDDGTAGTLAKNAANTAATVSDASSSGSADQLTQQQLVATLSVLQQTLAAMQQNGIQANLNMYGAGGAVDKMADALYQTKRRGTNKSVNRLFG